MELCVCELFYFHRTVTALFPQEVTVLCPRDADGWGSGWRGRDPRRGGGGRTGGPTRAWLTNLPNRLVPPPLLNGPKCKSICFVRGRSASGVVREGREGSWSRGWGWGPPPPPLPPSGRHRAQRGGGVPVIGSWLWDTWWPNTLLQGGKMLSDSSSN